VIEKGDGKREMGETETQCRFIEHPNKKIVLEMGKWRWEMGRLF